MVFQKTFKWKITLHTTVAKRHRNTHRPLRPYQWVGAASTSCGSRKKFFLKVWFIWNVEDIFSNVVEAHQGPLNKYDTAWNKRNCKIQLTIAKKKKARRRSKNTEEKDDNEISSGENGSSRRGVYFASLPSLLLHGKNILHWLSPSVSPKHKMKWSAETEFLLNMDATAVVCGGLRPSWSQCPGNIQKRYSIWSRAGMEDYKWWGLNMALIQVV